MCTAKVIFDRNKWLTCYSLFRLPVFYNSISHAFDASQERDWIAGPHTHCSKNGKLVQWKCVYVLCTICTILLTLWNSELKNGLLIKLFYFSSDFDETWWIKIGWKKRFISSRFSVQNFKVSVELCKSYIVRSVRMLLWSFIWTHE